MFTHNLLPLSAGLAIAALLSAGPASGALITFTPAGTQLDGDPILDIATTPGANIEFTIAVNTAGLGGNLTDISYRFNFDANELAYRAPSPQNPSPFDGNLSAGVFNSAFSAVTNTVALGGGMLAPNTSTMVNRINYTVLPGLVNDGASDFSPTILTAFANVGGVRTNVTAMFGAAQTVEVQPVPEPGSLALIGIGGLMLAWSRLGSRHEKGR